MDIIQRISHNLSVWMASNPNLDTIKKLSFASSVGFGTVQRAKNGSGNVTIQNLDLIAAAFKRPVTDLLVEPSSKIESVVTNISDGLMEDEHELLLGYQSAVPEVKEAMLNLARSANQKHQKIKSNEK